MKVGIRELKQGLSECLDLVAQGHVITVTDRGRAKAMIIPVPGTGEFERGIEEGWIREPTRPGLSTFQRVRGRESIAAVLDDDRGDR